ncbi:MAG: Trx7/PDZ domain-containing (seleno)protein [Pirellulaceae bacterium]|jgi:serine protease Do
MPLDHNSRNLNSSPWLLLTAVWVALLQPVQAQSNRREAKVRADRARVEAEGFWIYNQLELGWEQAKKQQRPLMVVLRCIPCEECVKLDDDLVDNHPALRPLLEQFVRVRVVSTNGLDLTRFQFDTDQSFAVFLFHPNGTLLGRYGTRSDQKEWAQDVSISGLRAALERALDWHRNFETIASSLEGKQGRAVEIPSPEQFPALRGKYGPALDQEGNLVKSCIHCHQIGDAQKAMDFERHGTLPEPTLFPFPHPKILGLIIDPATCGTVLRTEEDSPAERAGLQVGDEILQADGQSILSIADLQWVLHHRHGGAESLPLKVQRSNSRLEITVQLEDGWKRRGDLSWRASTWELRRRTLGGLHLVSLDEEARRIQSIALGHMALRVRHVGQFAPHDVAKRSGFLEDDIVIAWDGLDQDHSETDLIARTLQLPAERQSISVEVLRGTKRMQLELPIHSP